MSEPCAACPCPETCLRWPVWCEEWAPSGDPVKLAHIAYRSTHGPEPADPDAPSVVESIRLTVLMRDCEYRSVPPGCCVGGRCALRGGAVVSHVDCFACLTEYPVERP